MSRLLFEVVQKVDASHLLSSYLLKTCNQKSRTLQTKKKRGLETQIRESIMLVFDLEKTLKCKEELQLTMLLLLHKMPTVQHKQYR